MKYVYTNCFHGYICKAKVLFENDTLIKLEMDGEFHFCDKCLYKGWDFTDKKNGKYFFFEDRDQAWIHRINSLIIGSDK